jgi:microcystin-dependent protein
MADPFVAEIRIFPFSFAPKGWAFCDGQLLPISQNTALFSLLGTTYGGDGKSTFALPDMEGNSPMHPGQGPGLSLHDLGEMGGSETVTLLESEIPSHTHTLRGNFNTADINDPSPARALARSGTGFLYQSNTSANLTNMSGNALTPAGGGLPHNNMMPYLTLNYCIALQGVFPPRG